MLSIISSLSWRRGDKHKHLAELEALRQQVSATELAATLSRRQLSETNDELERLRASEKELLEAKRAAESAALAKGEFLATMSHEVRTPLNGILPILEIILRRPLEDELKRQVEAAYESAQEMRRIVNDVLDFSKLDAGAMRFETATVRPAEVVQSVVSLMKRAAEAKQIDLRCEIDKSAPPAVRSDALRLRQVITNLVANAIKFTARGEVCVELSQVGEDRTHRTIRVAVRDTGIGIAPDAASRLFEPFSQAEASMSRTHGGTGLGLAICRRIVDAMGGRIGVESALGRGSVFWFTVPVQRAAGEAPTIGTEQHALLFTRDESVKERWTAALESLGVRATGLVTAFETMKLLRTQLQSRGPAGLPQLVLVDLQSASKTAASVIRPLLSESEFASLRMLALGDSLEGLVDPSETTRVVLGPRDAPMAVLQRAIRASLGEGDPDHGAGPRIQLAEGTQERFDGVRVLLVDDIAINRYAGQLTLEKLGCVVTQANGGREAIEAMRRGDFDLVLMDCQMPDVDGFAATRVQRISERERRVPPVPILAVTANAMPGDRERCLEAGMNDHLAKPIAVAPLSRMLARWVRREDSTGGAENLSLLAVAGGAR